MTAEVVEAPTGGFVPVELSDERQTKKHGYLRVVTRHGYVSTARGKSARKLARRLADAPVRGKFAEGA